MREVDAYIQYVIDPQSRLDDQNPDNCPKTSFNRLMRECMQREPFLR